MTSRLGLKVNQVSSKRNARRGSKRLPESKAAISNRTWPAPSHSSFEGALQAKQGREALGRDEASASWLEFRPGSDAGYRS